MTSILGWDEDNDLIYFVATETGEPGTRQLYSVKPMKGNVIGSKKQSISPAKCITCKLFTSNKGVYYFIYALRILTTVLMQLN